MTLKFNHLDTLAVHAGRQDLTDLGVHALPIDLSSTNPLPNIEVGGDSYETLAMGGRPFQDGSHVYARLWNPTVARFEDAIAELEHAEASVAFSSGMAAVTAAFLSRTTSAGLNHVVAVRPLYGGTDHLLASGILGTKVTYCDPSEVAQNITSSTGLVVLESPANPTLELVNISQVVQQAGEVPVLVDNTFATPYLQNPIDHGAALSLHSVTKYISGHGDVVAGVIACNEETAEALRRVRAITGAILHPLGAYLAHRGLATLPVRMRAQQDSAQQLAEWLSLQDEVAEVFYPGMNGDPHAVLDTQMRGTGAMLSIRLKNGFEAASQLTSSVKLFTHAVSLGGVDSLIQHPAALTHRPVAAEAKPDEDIVRISVGLENPTDLITDLAQALVTTRQ